MADCGYAPGDGSAATAERRYGIGRVLALAGVLLAALPGPGRAEVRVWTAAHTARVLRCDGPPKGSGPREVNLAAGRNEWESFQVLVRSDAKTAGVTLEAGDLRGPGGAVLAAGDARLFRQHQLHLTVATYRNRSFRAGWYPDALIPLAHPVTRKALPAARMRAVPFDLPAGQTHGFWVDLHVPADAKAGRYRGTYRVTAGGRRIDVPVTLTVWDFTLPRVSTLATALGWPAARMRGYYAARAKAGKARTEKPPDDWNAVEAQCAEMLSRHRINCHPPPGMVVPRRQADGSYAIGPDQLGALKAFVARYHVNAIRIPHPRGVVKDPDREQAKLTAWLKAWDAAAKALAPRKVLFYTYLKDEPNDEEAYRYVQKWGRAVRRARSAVKVLVVEQTWTQNAKWGDLHGAVDIWCPLFSLFDPKAAARRRDLGETVWTYTALCQRDPTPWWHTDYPLLNYRAWAWIAWRNDISGVLYWGGMSFWKHVDDPWTDPKTYNLASRRADNKGPVYNGEGCIVYPARAAGYEGIAPSLRLKALRDAIEDYEYLAILARAGRSGEAARVVAPLAESWYKWNRDPAAYDNARAKLAAMILRANRTDGAQSRRE